MTTNVSRRRNCVVGIVLFCTIIEYYYTNSNTTNAFVITRHYHHHHHHHQTVQEFGMMTRTTTTTKTKLSLLNDDLLSSSSSSSSSNPSYELFSVQSAEQQQKQQQEQYGSSSSNNNIVLEEYNDFLPNPNIDWTAQDVVEGCMETILQNPTQGLEVCYSFSSDRCRAAIGGSLDKFNEYATNPVFQYLINCNEYKILHVGPIIPCTLTRGAMQTCLISVLQYNNQNVDTSNHENTGSSTTTCTSRNFLWTLQQERRPPNQGCWMVHEVLFVNNAYMQTV